MEKSCKERAVVDSLQKYANEGAKEIAASGVDEVQMPELRGAQLKTTLNGFYY